MEQGQRIPLSRPWSLRVRPHGCRVATEDLTGAGACALGKVSQPKRRGESRVRDAPVDRARSQPAVGPTELGGEYDQRLEVNGLPVVSSRGAIDPELCPQARCQVERERVDLLTEAGYGQGTALAEPSTFPYIMPRAISPSSERRTRMKVRAHVSMNPVSVSVSGCSESATLQRRLYATALTASPMVASRMISNAATELITRPARGPAIDWRIKRRGC